MAIANMTLFANDNERIIAVERFRPMLKSVQCGKRIKLVFNSKENFQYAKRQWNWVNENGQRKLILVANDPGCDDKDDQAPFVAHDVDYDEEHVTANFYGAQQPWEKVARDFDIDYARYPVKNGKSRLAKRRLGNWNKDWTLGIAHNFNREIFHLDNDKGSVNLKCVDCYTKGSFHASIHIKMRWFKLKTLDFKMTPKDVEANFELALQGKTRASSHDFGHAQNVFTMPVGPALPSIPGIGSFGFHLDMKLGASVTLHPQTATIKFGINSKFNNDAMARYSLEGKGDNKFSGWRPQFKALPVKLQGDFSGDASAFADWVIGAKIEIWKIGAHANIEARVPYFQTSVTTDSKKGSGTICAKKGKNGISAETQSTGYVGISLGPYLRNQKDNDLVRDLFGKGLGIAEKIFSRRDTLPGPEPGSGDDGSSEIEETPPRRLSRRAIKPVMHKIYVWSLPAPMISNSSSDLLRLVFLNLLLMSYPTNRKGTPRSSVGTALTIREALTNMRAMTKTMTTKRTTTTVRTMTSNSPAAPLDLDISLLVYMSQRCTGRLENKIIIM